MSGWSGGAANRTWQRGSRGPDDGRVAAHDDVSAILAQWRESHGYQPGYVWNPRTATYEAAG